ncbi:MAG: hypothetical protein ABWY06_07160 [Pseudomonas sp.]|uniref:hypothetical protein n=1 Tax=Pseudomonas sp. TaxID=306 RepID=UPI003394C382
MVDSSPALTARMLQQLERRRVLLERLIFIAGSLETLKSGLESLVDLTGDPTSATPMNVTVEALDRKLLAMEGPEIRLRLVNLDRELQSQFAQVQLLLEQLEQGETDQQVQLEHARYLIDAFHRCARTALALRWLLRQRGQVVDELQLPYERENLLRQLKGLTTQERAARHQVIGEIQDLAYDLDRLLNDPGLRPPMHELLGQLRVGLADNLLHLFNGGSVEHLPLSVELIDFSQAQTLVQLPLLEVTEMPDSIEPAAVEPAPPVEPEHPPLGFGQRLRLWLSTPWQVGWKDIRRDKKP